MMLRLPEEIQVDVLLRLPVKSILSCRCVCKHLYKLLHNPKFIKDHLLSHDNKNPRLMLISVVGGRAPGCRSITYSSILSASSASALSTTCTCDGAIPIFKYFQSEWHSGIRVVGSCNGLICISLPGGKRFLIWNPSTDDHKTLAILSASSAYNVKYGFGYDHHLDDYKLIRIEGDVKDCGYSQIGVCTLGKFESWKTIETMQRYLVLPSAANLSVWFLNGALHWGAFNNATSSMVIVSFDISTERVMEFLYPEGVNRRVYEKHDHVGILEERLSLVVCDGLSYSITSIDVWSMQEYGVRESWIKQFSFNPSCITNIGLFKLVWSFTTGEVLIDGCSEKLLYDPKKDSTKLLKIPGFQMDRSIPVSYVESLVSPRYFPST